MKKIIVASGNKGKIKEIKEIFNDFEVISMKELGIDLDTLEDQDSFSGNAIKKAKELSAMLKEPVIADDSGISIESLDGFPGVKTKRWMNGTDRQRNLGIIEKLNGVENRTCNFITAIAYVDKPQNIEIVKEHIIKGTITKAPRGENGFGFDEIFELPNGKTLAELSDEEKNEISPRKFALEDIKKSL